MFDHHRLKCYRLALDAAKNVPAITGKWPYYLSDQLKRALLSVILNIAEGNGRAYPKERRRFFNIAQASAKESAAILDIAYSYNLISDAVYRTMQDELLQVVKMLHHLP